MSSASQSQYTNNVTKVCPYVVVGMGNIKKDKDHWNSLHVHECVMRNMGLTQDAFSIAESQTTKIQNMDTKMCSYFLLAIENIGKRKTNIGTPCMHGHYYDLITG